MFTRGSRKYQKGLACVIVLSLQLNTVAYATSVVEPDRTQGKNPSVSQAANGVQVVDIRTPNSAGLSHNQYLNLQVGKEGLIFNNSANISKTELAGYINGNKYLAGNLSAKTILNEVTGNLPTNLNGYMEIAGKKADLILANPNGIVGNNFGYINTNRAVLTTGRPFLAASGDLDGFVVAKGNVNIEGLGLDAKNVSRVDILARASKLNAKIWAQRLNIVTGSNKVDYKTGDVKEVLSDEDIGVSLDVAALGGMYAGKIKLVGTAKGLGVNTEGVIDSSEGVIVTQEGMVINKSTIASKGTIDIQTNSSLINEGNINGENINISAVGLVNNTNSGKLSSSAATSISSKENIENKGEIAGGKNTNLNTAKDFNNTGLINGGDTKIEATQKLNNTDTGRIYGDNVTLKAEEINNIKGGVSPVIASRQDMTLEANVINNKEHTLISSEGNMSIKAGTLNNNSAIIEAGKDLTINANNVNNTNEHFATEVQIVKEEDIKEVQGKGQTQRYNLADYTYDFNNEYGASDNPPYDIYYGDESDDSYSIYLPGHQRVLDWYRYEYHRTTKENVIISTDPAKISAGNNLTFTGGTVTNDKSQILAGGTIAANVSTLNNIEGTGKRYVEENGKTHYYHQEDSGHAWWHEMVTEHDEVNYIPPTVVTDIVVKASEYKANTTPVGSGTSAESYTYSSLYHNSPNPTASYFVETDSAFTNKKQWLSSDYFFIQSGYDVEKVAKRLGDGYYEQKLVSNEVMNLTGRRFLDGYKSNEEQYKALMDSAAAFAKDNNLTIGIAPTKEQLVNLKTPIVWMVEESVVLPNGEIVKALVPKVYVSQEDSGVMGTTVIGAETLDIHAINDILNEGTIVAGSGVNLSANNINNYGGTIKGSDVILNAMNDVNNVGGTFVAASNMDIIAGNNVNFTTTTTSAQNANGSRTNINQVAGASVTGDKGNLNIKAGNDVNLTAADINTSGKDSSLNISAGQDINLNTVKTGSSNDIVFDKDNYRHDKESVEVGTAIQSGGNLNLSSGRDTNAKGAYVVAEEALKVTSGRDINITAGESNTSVVEHHKYTNSGLLSSTTTESHTTSDEHRANGSTFSGDTVDLKAGQDVNVTGSNVVGTKDVNIKADRNVNIKASDEQLDYTDYNKTTTSGVMGSGMGITIGTSSTKVNSDTQSSLKKGSTVGSIEGNVNITAGNKATVEASDIIAGKDINLTAKDVTVTSANEKYASQYKYEQNTTGLTVSLGGGSLGNIEQKILEPLNRATEVQDKRLAALNVGKAAFNYANSKNLKQDVQDLAKGKASIGVNVGFGTSSTKQTSDSVTSVSKGSNLQAGGKVNINATDKDINIQGSSLAGENINLSAKENVNITASENTNRTDTDNKNSSVGIGVGLGANSGLYVNASLSKENIKENWTTYTTSIVEAKDNLTITSGKDTNIIGSEVSGNKVNAEVGGNLNIESKQESQSYKETNASVGISASTRGFSGSASAGKMNSDYASVNNQAGVFAGSEGFAITVEGNTDLKGAVIDSTASEDKNNMLTTGTLSFNDIENKADYDTAGFGISYDSVATKDKDALMGDKGLIPSIPMASGDEANSTTKSGVAQGTITITDKDKQKQDISSLNRNTADTINKLDQIFDKDTIKEKQEMGALFAELAFNSIHGGHMSEGQRAMAHAVIGLIAADLANSKSPVSSMLSAGINEFVVQEITKDPAKKAYYDKHPEQLQRLSAAVGAAVSDMTGGSATGGASISASGTKNNWAFAIVIAPAVKEALAVLGLTYLTTPEGQKVVKDSFGKVVAKGNAAGEWLVDTGNGIMANIGKGWDRLVTWAKKTRQSGKEGATDIPSWAKNNGVKPKAGESGNEFAKRVCDERFGKDNYSKGPKSDYNQLKKYGDRHNK